MNEPLKRPPLLIAIALLVMAGCVLVAGQSAAIVTRPEPSAIVVGAALFAFSILIGLMEYLAVFRRSELATRVAAGLLLFLAAAYGVMSLFDAISPRTPWPTRLAPIAVAAFLGWAAWQNYKWRFALRAYYKTSPAPADRWQISLTEILGATLAVALVTAIASHDINNLPKP